MSQILDAYLPVDGLWKPFLSPSTVSPPSVESLGALITSAELDMWKDRAANGPFRTSGDFSNNSPGHWDQMDAARSRDFSADRWSGPTDTGGDGRVLNLDESSSQTSNDPPEGTRVAHHDMMSAAYAAMIVDDTDLAATIRGEIEWHANQSRLDFSDRTRFPYDYYDDLNPLFMYCLWVQDLVIAYDVVKAMGYTSSTAEGWFLDLADLAENALHGNLSVAFPDRKSDDYISRDSFVDSTLYGPHTYQADGTAYGTPRITLWYNNRRSAQAGFLGMAGVVAETQEYIDECKRYGREWLMFGHRTTPGQETHGDINRGKNYNPQLALGYDQNAFGVHLLPAWDAIARTGDTSLYDFSSSEGADFPSVGTNHLKSMEEILEQRIKWINGDIEQYTGDGSPPSSSIVGDPYYRIKTRSEQSGNEYVTDGGLLHAAIYYGRTEWVDVIMRQGTPTGFTSTPHSSGAIWGWRTDWRTRFLRSFDANPYGG